ncbi:MAG: hypothetical protein L0Y55_00555 [Anaerolineales bacterium]|nr:hypothetical protein [Anaerolineales bacterium]
MDPILSLLDSTIGARQARMLGVLLLFLPIFFFAYWAVKRGARFALRPIAAYAALKGLFARSAEAGQPVHLSLGTTGVGDQFTADTTAALNVLEYLAERGAISAAPLLVTLAHPTALPVAQDILRRVYRQMGMPEEYEPTRARLLAPDPLSASTPRQDAFAYAVGAMRLLTQQKLVANVMIGRFGDEFLLMSEAGAQRALTQIGGTSAPEVLPFVNATMTHPLIGEEIYAGGAYLSGKPAHVSSLLAQDIMRWLIVAGVVGAIVFRTLGLI